MYLDGLHQGSPTRMLTLEVNQKPVISFSGTSEIRPPSGPSEVVLLLDGLNSENILYNHVYMHLGLNQSGLITKVVVL